ncbi:MAG: GAF domain-containing protein [Nitrospinae bacterium]|nr:GAF domain-containing protein [Nitrospinota bacterium]
MVTIKEAIEMVLSGEEKARADVSSLSEGDKETAPVVNRLLEAYEGVCHEREIYRNGLRETLELFEKGLKSLSTIRKIGELSVSVKTVDEVCGIAVRAFKEELDFENCSIMLLDERGEYLELRAVSGWGDMINGKKAGKKIKMGEGIAGTVAVTQMPIFIPDVKKDERFKELPSHVKIGTIFCLPLFSKEELLGVINLSHPEAGAIKLEQEEIFLTLSHVVGHLIIKARLHSELMEFKRDLEKKVEEKTAELKKKTKEAESANRLKTEFLATVSHELRTPMTSILGFTKLLFDMKDIPKEAMEFIKIIWSQGERLEQLIGDLLDVAQIESGRVGLEISEYNINLIIKEVVALFKPDIMEKGLDLILNLEEESSTAEIDQKRIAQVLWNLLNNAIKYTHRGGEITITSEEKGDEIHVAVSDTGIGIKKEDYEIIFDRFRQLDSSLTREFGGVGLGLSISKYFVEVHGGSIWVESEFGKGSTFTFSIPKKVKGREIVSPKIFDTIFTGKKETSVEGAAAVEKREDLLRQAIIDLRNEINNPLTIIIGDAELLLRKLELIKGLGEDLEGHLKSIILAAQWIKSFVSRVSKVI